MISSNKIAKSFVAVILASLLSATALTARTPVVGTPGEADRAPVVGTPGEADRAPVVGTPGEADRAPVVGTPGEQD